jgi:hypothetical protein
LRRFFLGCGVAIGSGRRLRLLVSFGEPEPWLLERLAEFNGENIEPFAARTFA